MAESEGESPTSSASTSADSTATPQVESEAGPSQDPGSTGTGTGTMDAEASGSGSGSGEIVGNTDQQEGEDMQVQVDGNGAEAGNDQGEDMVIESGPSHIGKRVKVCLALLHLRMVK